MSLTVDAMAKEDLRIVKKTEENGEVAMKVKNIWSDEDFDAMSWHDSPIHSVLFSPDLSQIVFDIDYIFQWDWGQGNRSKYWVSPCRISFDDVFNLRISLDCGDDEGLDVIDISRTNRRLSGVDGLYLWDYSAEITHGEIAFTASGFAQVVLRQPVLSESRILPR